MFPTRLKSAFLRLAAVCVSFATAMTHAGEPDPVAPVDEQQHQKIAEYLSGAVLTGGYRNDAGKSGGVIHEESYEIKSCEPIGGDRHRLTVRIRYGEVDADFPVELSIYFAAGTPVLTLQDAWIPGLGTFSARVLIQNDRYAGTWQHDAVGGHLFGAVETKPTP